MPRRIGLTFVLALVLGGRAGLGHAREGLRGFRAPVVFPGPCVVPPASPPVYEPPS